MNIAPESVLQQARSWLQQADGLLITAGAGMGVDSGLPDFRGNEGFWNAYPALGRRRMVFSDVASPDTFVSDPLLAWGFYGHRLNLYRQTVPHPGFQLLREWGDTIRHGAFVVTSNVDGQFQKAGFDAGRIVEIHGSIHHQQCLQPCCHNIWTADAAPLQIDHDNCRLMSPLPRCPYCGGIARPNILMFNDWHWLSVRTALQQARLEQWLRQVKRPLVIELGAGVAIPSIRRIGERHGWALIRINPRDSAVGGRQQIALPMSALEGLQAIAGAEWA